ncbi:MAG: universal stress protein [Oscillatoria sp. PMC 1051.18]|nr:universal stress protein [Oscillatoria sp. PMC 1050.18]MEC5032000.1 universal stress protein [Oscillatoria sp. PMC 1051.18]
MKISQPDRELLPNETPTLEGLTDSGFKKILVALDRQSEKTIFAKALKLASQGESNLMIFHGISEQLLKTPDMVNTANPWAFDGFYPPDNFEYFEKVRQEALNEVLSWLRSLCETATNLGIPTEFDYKMGDPGHVICNCAKNWGADLIIVGRRGRSGLSEILLGSVSNYVLHHATCAVLVVQ